MTDERSSLITDDDVYLFNEGSALRLYEKLGAHLVPGGVHFAVWALDAEAVSVIGDFNGWQPGKDPLQPRGDSGLWEGAVSGIGKGTVYKYHVSSRHNGYKVAKADPFAVYSELPPKTASVVWDLDYAWQDADWMATRKERQTLASPVSIYELHLGSWRRVPDEAGGSARPMTYREIAAPLAAYAKELANAFEADPEDAETGERFVTAAGLLETLSFPVELWRIQNAFYRTVHRLLDSGSAASIDPALRERLQKLAAALRVRLPA